MKFLIIGLSMLNGLWMLIDGIHVLAVGKYIGPEKPGPWASLLGMTGVDVFKLGPLFVIFGIAWLVLSTATWTEAGLAKGFGIILSIATLWYLPFGTLISLILLGILVFFI